MHKNKDQMGGCFRSPPFGCYENLKVLQIESPGIAKEVLKQLLALGRQDDFTVVDLHSAPVNGSPKIRIARTSNILPPALTVCGQVVCTLDEPMRLLVLVDFGEKLLQLAHCKGRKLGVELQVELLLLIELGCPAETGNPILNRRRNVRGPDFGHIVEDAHPEHLRSILFIMIFLFKSHDIGKYACIKQMPKDRTLDDIRVSSPPCAIPEVRNHLQNLENLAIAVSNIFQTRYGCIVRLESLTDFLTLPQIALRRNRRTDFHQFNKSRNLSSCLVDAFLERARTAGKKVCEDLLGLLSDNLTSSLVKYVTRDVAKLTDLVDRMLRGVVKDVCTLICPVKGNLRETFPTNDFTFIFSKACQDEGSDAVQALLGELIVLGLCREASPTPQVVEMPKHLVSCQNVFVTNPHSSFPPSNCRVFLLTYNVTQGNNCEYRIN